MRTYITTISLLLLFISCNSNKSSYKNADTFTFNSFKSTKKLKGNSLEINEFVMNPSDILVHDSLLITIEQGLDKIFYVYNLNTQSLINECIIKGQGPDDMIYPEFINCDGSVLSIVDLETSTIFEYYLQDFISDSTPKAVSRIKLEEDVFICAQKTDDNILGYSYITDKRLNKFDLTGKKIGELIDYPDSEIKYSDMERMDAYYMQFIYNGKDRIALCHYMTDLIEIYDMDGVLIKRIHGPEQFLAHFKQREDGPMGASPIKDMNRDSFMSPRNAGDNFFVLYNGGHIDDPEHTSSCNKILSFTWDGKPQYIYEIDDSIFSFTIDPKNKKIYGISNTPEYHIVEYSY